MVNWSTTCYKGLNALMTGILEDIHPYLSPSPHLPAAQTSMNSTEQDTCMPRLIYDVSAYLPHPVSPCVTDPLCHRPLAMGKHEKNQPHRLTSGYSKHFGLYALDVDLTRWPRAEGAEAFGRLAARQALAPEVTLEEFTRCLDRPDGKKARVVGVERGLRVGERNTVAVWHIYSSYTFKHAYF